MPLSLSDPAATVTAEIKRPVDQFVDTWNRHDMKAFADLFAADAQFVNVVGLWWKGRDEIYGAHAFVHSNMFKASRLTALETAIRTPTDSLAIARTRWRLEGHTTPDGTALPPRTGLLVMVLQRTGAAWSIIDAQNTDIVADEIIRPQQTRLAGAPTVPAA